MKIARKIEVPREDLAEMLEYNPLSGELRWRVRPAHLFDSPVIAKSWNRRFAGRKAGSQIRKPSGHVYTRIGIGYQNLAAHRVIWLLVYGSIDDQMVIDHVNGIGTDNRLLNLRLVSSSENSKNRSVSERSRSGVIGVYWNSHERKWHARVQINGKRRSIGQYDSIEDAQAARKAAEADQGYHPLHGLSREARASSN